MYCEVFLSAGFFLSFSSPLTPSVLLLISFLLPLKGNSGVAMRLLAASGRN